MFGFFKKREDVFHKLIQEFPNFNPLIERKNLRPEKPFMPLKNTGIIRKVAFGYTSTFADREDLSQEITLQLWRSYPRYSPERPFSTWM